MRRGPGALSGSAVFVSRAYHGTVLSRYVMVTAYLGYSALLISRRTG